MALSRTQIKVLNYVGVESSANKLEELIDEFLRDAVTDVHHVYRWNLRRAWDKLEVQHGGDREEVISILEPRYRRAGWDLTYDGKSGNLLITEV